MSHHVTQHGFSMYSSKNVSPNRNEQRKNKPDERKRMDLLRIMLQIDPKMSTNEKTMSRSAGFATYTAPNRPQIFKKVRKPCHAMSPGLDLLCILAKTNLQNTNSTNKQKTNPMNATDFICYVCCSKSTPNFQKNVKTTSHNVTQCHTAWISYA